MADFNNTIAGEEPLSIDLNTTTAIACERCDNQTFQRVTLLRKVSAIMGKGKEGIVPVPLFACNACGHVNKEFLPMQGKTQTSTIIAGL